MHGTGTHRGITGAHRAVRIEKAAAHRLHTSCMEMGRMPPIGGRIKRTKGEAKLFRDHLVSLEGTSVHVTVGKVKGLRTEPQMRYYWGVVVNLMGDDTGDDIDIIHECLKDKFAPRKTLTVPGEAR